MAACRDSRSRSGAARGTALCKVFCKVLGTAGGTAWLSHSEYLRKYGWHRARIASINHNELIIQFSVIFANMHTCPDSRSYQKPCEDAVRCQTILCFYIFWTQHRALLENFIRLASLCSQHRLTPGRAASGRPSGAASCRATAQRAAPDIAAHCTELHGWLQV